MLDIGEAFLLPVLTFDDDHLLAVLAGKAQAAPAPTFAPEPVARSAPGKLCLPFAHRWWRTMLAMVARKGDPDFFSVCSPLGSACSAKRAGWASALITRLLRRSA